MFVNISPAESNASETICSLAFASRCRDVALGAASNKPDAIELAKAKQEIRALKAKLAAAAPATKGR
jgi:kinesin family protein C2/C3